jgi:hypothetical protein
MNGQGFKRNGRQCRGNMGGERGISRGRKGNQCATTQALPESGFVAGQDSGDAPAPIEDRGNCPVDQTGQAGQGPGGERRRLRARDGSCAKGR